MHQSCIQIKFKHLTKKEGERGKGLSFETNTVNMVRNFWEFASVSVPKYKSVILVILNGKIRHQTER